MGQGPRGAVQVSQLPVQAASQQTVSRQKPERPGRPRPQVAPLSRVDTHSPPAQKVPLAQSSSRLQTVGQAAPPSHREDPQPPPPAPRGGPAPTAGEPAGPPAEPAATGVQVPGTALHASQPPAQAMSQQKPSTQLPVAHWVARVHEAPLASWATHCPPALQ